MHFPKVHTFNLYHTDLMLMCLFIHTVATLSILCYIDSECVCVHYIVGYMYISNSDPNPLPLFSISIGVVDIHISDGGGINAEDAVRLSGPLAGLMVA